MNDLVTRLRSRKGEAITRVEKLMDEAAVHIEAQKKLIDAMREALEIIAGVRPCVDNLLSNADIARLALSKSNPNTPREERGMSEGSGNLLLSGEMTVEKASRFLDECAVYFERRPTGGEDSAYWANVYNAEWCRKISAYIAGTEQKLRTTSLEALAISDTNNEIQARLSEAVKVLEAYLNEYEGVYDMAATKERPAYRSDGAKAAEDAARKFLATLGEET